MRLAPDTTREWLLAGGVLLVAAWALSVVGAVVAFAGFTVARDGDRLRIRRGLLSRREATVPVARVRAVRSSRACSGARSGSRRCRWR